MISKRSNWCKNSIPVPTFLKLDSKNACLWWYKISAGKIGILNIIWIVNSLASFLIPIILFAFKLLAFLAQWTKLIISKSFLIHSFTCCRRPCLSSKIRGDYVPNFANFVKRSPKTRISLEDRRKNTNIINRSRKNH